MSYILTLHKHRKSDYLINNHRQRERFVATSFSHQISIITPTHIVNSSWKETSTLCERLVERSSWWRARLDDVMHSYCSHQDQLDYMIVPCWRQQPYIDKRPATSDCRTWDRHTSRACWGQSDPSIGDRLCRMKRRLGWDMNNPLFTSFIFLFWLRLFFTLIKFFS